MARTIESGLAEIRSRYVGQGPDFGIDTLDDFLDFVGSGGTTWSGAQVTTTTAMRVATVWACQRLISEGLAQIPIITYRVSQDGSKERARDHYLWPLLHDHANEQMTAYRFKRLLQTWILQRGNAYARMEINGRGQVTNLYPWNPSRVRVRSIDGDPLYAYRLDNGTEIQETWSNVLHLRGFESDGFFGLTPIEVHKNTFGLALSIQEHGARFFANAARPFGVFKTSAKYTPDQIDKFKEQWNAACAGPNVHKAAVLPLGFEYQQVGLKASEAQFIETMQLTVEQICQIYGVLPPMIGVMGRATWGNLSEVPLRFLQDTLGPHAANWEAQLKHSLLSDREAETIHIEFLMDALMRTNAQQRAQYFAQALQWRWMTPNEVRRRDGLNPVPEGDAFLVTNVASPGASGEAAEMPMSAPQEEE